MPSWLAMKSTVFLELHFHFDHPVLPQDIYCCPGQTENTGKAKKGKEGKPCGWSELVLWVPAVRSKADGLCCALQMLKSGQQTHNSIVRFQQLKIGQIGFVGLFCFVSWHLSLFGCYLH